MKNNFFSEHLQLAESRIVSTKPSSCFCLDKNEQSVDIDIELKNKVLESLLHADWNRYPSSDYSDIEIKVAEYCNLRKENIVLSPGSANMITTLLNYFALNKKNIVIGQPSYSLFDYHCKTYNIPYTPWMLSANLEYDLESLPTLDADSVLIVTSPNNPVGNSISYHQLELLLITNPESLIILDGVYTEFSKTDFTRLVNQYDNLIVLRSFSKAFPIAGLRLGYLCATPKMAAVIKKLVLQFSITPFTLTFAREMLFNPTFMANAKQRVQQIISERERMAHYVKRNFANSTLQVFPSEGNFLLMRVADDASFANLMAGFAKTGIKILNTTNFALLKNTFRVSIGNTNENDVVMYCLAKNLVAVEAVSSKSRYKNFKLPVPFLQPLTLQVGLN